MKEYEVKEAPRVVLKKAICDNCKKDCTNTHTDVMLKHSYNDEPDLLKTVCFKCYFELYHKEYHKNKDLQFKKDYQK